MTTLQPGAYRQASAVRRFGIGVTGLLSLLGGAIIAALLAIMFVAIGLHGVYTPFVPALLASLVVFGYLVAAPPLFASRTRAATAATATGWLVAAVGGYLAFGVLLVLAL